MNCASALAAARGSSPLEHLVEEIAGLIVLESHREPYC